MIPAVALGPFVALAAVLGAARQAPAPWSAEPLPGRAVPGEYAAAHLKAPNRRTCAVLAFRRVGPMVSDAEPRRAPFSGGWSVAYDRPGRRSAFGIAGTGSVAADTVDMYRWPNTIRWADGSWATYGPEGGTGPNTLAYLYVAGQGCLYNVWSRLGEDHLRRLLRELRFVRW